MPQGCAKKTSKNKVRLVEDENHKVERVLVYMQIFSKEFYIKNINY